MLMATKPERRSRYTSRRLVYLGRIDKSVDQKLMRTCFGDRRPHGQGLLVRRVYSENDSGTTRGRRKRRWPRKLRSSKDYTRGIHTVSCLCHCSERSGASRSRRARCLGRVGTLPPESGGNLVDRMGRPSKGFRWRDRANEMGWTRGRTRGPYVDAAAQRKADSRAAKAAGRV